MSAQFLCLFSFNLVSLCELQSNTSHVSASPQIKLVKLFMIDVQLKFFNSIHYLRVPELGKDLSSAVMI